MLPQPELSRRKRQPIRPCRRYPASRLCDTGRLFCRSWLRAFFDAAILSRYLRASQREPSKNMCFGAIHFSGFRVYGFKKLGRALQEGFLARGSLRKIHPPQEVLEAGIGGRHFCPAAALLTTPPGLRPLPFNLSKTKEGWKYLLTSLRSILPDSLLLIVASRYPLIQTDFPISGSLLREFCKKVDKYSENKAKNEPHFSDFPESCDYAEFVADVQNIYANIF